MRSQTDGTKASNEHIIERRFSAMGDNLDNTWRPVATLNGFSYYEAQAKLREYGIKYGFSSVRMRRTK